MVETLKQFFERMSLHIIERLSIYVLIKICVFGDDENILNY